LVSGSVPRPLYRGGQGTEYGVGNGIGEPAGTDPVFVGFLGNRFGEPAGTDLLFGWRFGSLSVPVVVRLSVTAGPIFGRDLELLGGVFVGVPGAVGDASFADGDAFGA
jgi:hypothetical protein